MFAFITAKWNPIVGCSFLCLYCWARALVAGRLRSNPRYRDGFKPRIIETELEKRFKAGEFVFLTDMGDAFCDGVPSEWILRVLEVVRACPDARFLCQTKNPQRYTEFASVFPRNVVLGATIESNRDYRQLSRAPSQSSRLTAMQEIAKLRPDLSYFIAVEPILKFDLAPFVSQLKAIRPWAVAVGYDNWGYRLDEPTLADTEALVGATRTVHSDPPQDNTACLVEKWELTACGVRLELLICEDASLL
jgi:hypothetical protein